MNVSIPQVVTGIISMFIAILGIRVVSVMVNPILELAWKNSLALTSTKLVVYIIIGFIIYVIVYGTIMGKAPNILKTKSKENEESWKGYD